MERESKLNQLIKRHEKAQSSIARAGKIMEGLQNRTIPNLTRISADIESQVEVLKGELERENYLPLLILDYEKGTAQINGGERRELSDFEWELIAYFGDKKKLGEEEIPFADLTKHAREMGASGNSASYLVTQSIKRIRNKFSDYPDLITTLENQGKVSVYKLNAKVEIIEDDGGPQETEVTAQEMPTGKIEKDKGDVSEEPPTDQELTGNLGITNLRSEVPAIINKIADELWENLTPLDRDHLTEAFFQDPERIRSQVDEMTRYLTEFRKSKVEIPTPSQILGATAQETKRDLATSKLKSLISLSLTEPQHSAIKTVVGWGRQLNDLILLLGGSEQARETLFQAINSLDDLSRALLLSRISMTKRYEILKVGIDQANEREMAFFINIATYTYIQNGDAGDLEEVVISTMERDLSTEQFSATRVVESIIQHYPNYPFARLIQAARQLDFVGHLEDLFSSHPQTLTLALAIENEKEEGAEIVPWNRRL